MLNVFDKRDELLAQTMEFICRSMNVKNIFLLRFENEAYSMGRVYIYMTWKGIRHPSMFIFRRIQHT
ncbi:hypothetical protein MKC97_00880 [[Clostridium] innocuum]|nr:hypothetical protein [[Clostridium] innocuum]